MLILVIYKANCINIDYKIVLQLWAENLIVFSALIKKKKKQYSSLLYIHYSSHNLNITISYSCNVPEIRNTICTIESVCLYFILL